MENAARDNENAKQKLRLNIVSGNNKQNGEQGAG